MKSTLTRRLALSLFAGATLLATGASAQTFPERIIKWWCRIRRAALRT